MSVPSAKVREIRDNSMSSLDRVRMSNSNKIREAKKQLVEVEEKLFNVEEKWIANQIQKDTYDRWHATYTESLDSIKANIARLSIDQSEGFKLLERNLDLLTDMEHVYKNAPTLQKRSFLDMVFDSNLYYKDGIYRTPTMASMFSHKYLIMK